MQPDDLFRRQKRLERALLGLATLVLVLGGYVLHGARAEGIPSAPSMYYSGTLEEGGVAVQGQRQMSLRLFDGPSEDAEKLCESIPNATGGAPGKVTVNGGRFRFEVQQVQDGVDLCAKAVREHPELYAELVVNGEPFARSRIGVVPFAIEAEHAVYAEHAVHAEHADSAANGLDTRISKIESSLLRAPTGTVDVIGPNSPVSVDGHPLRVVAASVAGTTNANGDLQINFPTAFGGRVLAVVVSNGDASSAVCGSTIGAYAYTNTSFLARSPAANASCRFNYVAIGW